MRWIFASTQEEIAHKRQMLARIDDFWQALVPRLSEHVRLSTKTGAEFPTDLVCQLVDSVDQRIMWEFGPPLKNDGAAHLVLTCEVDRQLRPLVSTMLARAPKLEGWSFHAYRQHTELSDAQALVRSRVGGSIEGWKVKLLRSGAKIDVKYLVPTQGEQVNRDQSNCAFVATEYLLGEQVLDKWIGEIDVEMIPANRANAEPGAQKTGYELGQLRSLVMSLIHAHRDQLPSLPYQSTVTEDSPAWMAELTPPTFIDHGTQFSDVVVVTTQIEKLLLGLMQPLFNSAAHSKLGERFGVVKIRQESGLDEDALKLKSDLWSSLSGRLSTKSLGCVVGSMTGLEHSYLIVCLSKLVEGARDVQAHLAEQRVPKESWLFFADPELSGEWLGAYPDTPVPGWIPD